MSEDFVERQRNLSMRKFHNLKDMVEGSDRGVHSFSQLVLEAIEEVHHRIDSIEKAMSPTSFQEAANWKGMFSDLQKVNDSMQTSLEYAAQTMLKQEEEIATIRELLAKSVEGHVVEEWNDLRAQLQSAKKQSETLREENIQMKNKLATIYGNYGRPI